MPATHSPWNAAQQRERRYYAMRAAVHEAGDEVYAEFHAPFWKGILQRVKDLSFRDGGVYVDVGCGPNPIVAFVDRGRRIGVDPLMRFYQEHFKFPEDFEAYEGVIEDLAPLDDGEADVIFSMNNIDHIQDLRRAATTLRRKLKHDGLLVVSVNVVGNPLTALVAKAFDVYRVIDRTHTYHFHSPQDVAAALSPYFRMVQCENIESLSVEMQGRKATRDRQSLSIKGMVRTGLKFVKNDILLREQLFLMVYRPTEIAADDQPC